MSDEPPRARAMECTVAEYAELERWCRAKILAALDRWQDEGISRRLATTPSPIYNQNAGADGGRRNECFAKGMRHYSRIAVNSLSKKSQN